MTQDVQIGGQVESAGARRGAVIAEDVADVVAASASDLERLAGGTLLVTGGGGFLCSYLVDAVAEANETLLAASPCRIAVVDNLRTGMPTRLEHLAGREDVTFLEHDVTEPLHLDDTPDWIVHGASIASPTFYRRYPLETIDANVIGTRRLLDLTMEGARSFLCLSTSEIYGDPDADHIPTSEDYVGHVSCTGPRACYDESKRLAETLCSTYWHSFQTPVKVIRPFNVYGPGQRLDDRRIIPDLMSAALRGGPLVLLSDGLATRSFCYVTDAIRAMLAVLVSEENGEPFNVGNDEEEITIRDLAGRLAEIAGPPPLEVEHQVSSDPDYHADNPQRRCPNLTKLRSRLGWEAKVALREGLARTLRSYREEGGGERHLATSR